MNYGTLEILHLARRAAALEGELEGMRIINAAIDHLLGVHTSTVAQWWYKTTNNITTTTEGN